MELKIVSFDEQLQVTQIVDFDFQSQNWDAIVIGLELKFLLYDEVIT